MSLRFLAWTNLITICSAELESEITSNFNCDGKPISKTDPSSLKWKSYRCLTPWFILRSSSLISSWERASGDFFTSLRFTHNDSSPNENKSRKNPRDMFVVVESSISHRQGTLSTCKQRCFCWYTNLLGNISIGVTRGFSLIFFIWWNIFYTWRRWKQRFRQFDAFRSTKYVADCFCICRRCFVSACEPMYVLKFGGGGPM